MALAMIPACMGGACAQRDHCGRHLTAYRANVVERLCQRGDEQPEPVDLAAWVGAAMQAGGLNGIDDGTRRLGRIVLTDDSEHSRIDGDAPAAQVAVLRHQRPRWDKSIGHGQSDQGADLTRSIIYAGLAPRKAL